MAATDMAHLEWVIKKAHRWLLYSKGASTLEQELNNADSNLFHAVLCNASHMHDTCGICLIARFC